MQVYVYVRQLAGETTMLFVLQHATFPYAQLICHLFFLSFILLFWALKFFIFLHISFLLRYLFIFYVISIMCCYSSCLHVIAYSHVIIALSL